MRSCRWAAICGAANPQSCTLIYSDFVEVAKRFRQMLEIVREKGRNAALDCMRVALVELKSGLMFTRQAHALL
jgi:hypothetical protein